MQPSRILPDLQCSLVCEEVRQEMNGNFIIIGVLNYVRVPQLPVTALRLTVFTRWTAGLIDAFPVRSTESSSRTRSAPCSRGTLP